MNIEIYRTLAALKRHKEVPKRPPRQLEEAQKGPPKDVVCPGYRYRLGANLYRQPGHTTSFGGSFWASSSCLGGLLGTSLCLLSAAKVLGGRKTQQIQKKIQKNIEKYRKIQTIKQNYKNYRKNIRKYRKNKEKCRKNRKMN